MRKKNTLKGKSYRINRPFLEEIEQARKSLNPIMKDLKRKGEKVKLVWDILYVNGEPYYPESEVERREPPRDKQTKDHASQKAEGQLYTRPPIGTCSEECNKW